jgi:XTP/dITP diphosphohydrolase
VHEDTETAEARQGSKFLELVEVMHTLRSPGGCPWDAEQTHASLVKYLLEEAYETAEAIEDADEPALREELGDVLLQVVFHARIAQERPVAEGGGWDIDDVAAGVVDNLVRRHPHVFGDAVAHTAGDVESNWEALKAVEKGRTSAVDGIPLGQPALALASALVGRTAKAGLDVPVDVPVERPSVVDEESIGELLLAVVALARHFGVDAETALRGAARRYRARVITAEQANGPAEQANGPAEQANGPAEQQRIDPSA